MLLSYAIYTAMESTRVKFYFALIEFDSERLLELSSDVRNNVFYTSFKKNSGDIGLNNGVCTYLF